MVSYIPISKSSGLRDSILHSKTLPTSSVKGIHVLLQVYLIPRRPYPSLGIKFVGIRKNRWIVMDKVYSLTDWGLFFQVNPPVFPRQYPQYTKIRTYPLRNYILVVY